MAQVFIWIYDFFSKRLWLLISILVVLVAMMVFFVSKIRLEEDITKIVPIDEKTKELNLTLQNSNFMDKLIVNVYIKDTSAQPQPDSLIAFTDQLVDSFSASLMPVYLKDITYSIEESAMFDMYNTFFDYMPLFLKDKDYAGLDSMLTPKNIDKTLKNNYKSLLSPAGMMTKKFIIRDPLSLATLSLKRLEELKFDESYEFYKNRIFVNNNKNLLLFLSTTNASETGHNTQLIEKMDSLIQRAQARYGNKIKVEYFGSVAIGVCNANRLKKDIMITLSIAMVLLLLFISIFFKKPSVFFMIFTPAIFGGGMALMILYFIKSEISSIALGIGSVLLGITVDYSLHLYTHYRSKGDIKLVLKDLVTPMAMSCLTTAAAFLCLIFLHSEALFDLGLFAAISVFTAAVFSAIVLPHFIGKNKSGGIEKDGTHKKTIVDRLVSYPFDKKKWLVLIILGATVVFYFTSKNVEFESDMTRLGYLSDDLITAEQNLDRLTEYKLRSVLLISHGKDLQEALQTSESIQNKIDSLKEADIIKKYTSVSSLIMSTEMQHERISRWNDFWQSKQIDSVKSMLIEAGSKYKFKEFAFNDFFALLDKPATAVDISKFSRMKELFLDKFITEKENSAEVVTMLKVARNDKAAVYKAFEGVENVSVTDMEHMTNKFLDLLKSDFNLLVTISLLIVFCILVAAFGRIELALITLIPMLLSWLWTFGIMGALDIKFTIFSVMISTFIFGLGVDYSIFITRGLMQENKYGHKNLNSYKTSIFLSALTTITGIGVLIFALHPALRSIAALSVIGIVSVVLISYTIQPLLFEWMVSKKNKKRPVPVTIFGFIYAVVCYTYFLSGGFLSVILSYTVFWLAPTKRIRKKLIHWSIYIACRSTIYVMFMMRKNIQKPKKVNFKKPAVYICNHQSLIDIPLSLMFTPKMIVLTTDWVQNNLMTGILSRMADFYPVSLGLDVLVEKLRDKVAEGYSIFIFPEGTRSKDCKLKRFHKGACYIAEHLELDIVPMIMHGTGHYVSKGQYLGRKSLLTVKFLDPISMKDEYWGTTYKERTRKVASYFKEEWKKVEKEYKTVEYNRDLLIKSYILKGPVLEWYMRLKINAECNYRVFNSLVPENAVVTDMGCGYGFLSHMLALVSDERTVTGVDYDEEKILVAQNCAINIGRVNFHCADISLFEVGYSDVFILSDTLHYLQEKEQERVIINCIEKLNEGGRIIIKDGNCEIENRHLSTKYTEFCSTKFGFNKTKNELCFTSRSKIGELVSKYGMTLEVAQSSRFTSNEIYVVERK